MLLLHAAVRAHCKAILFKSENDTMFDRTSYELELEKVKARQVEEIPKYLAKYMEINTESRKQPIDTAFDETAREKILNMSISNEGRDFTEVADEMIENIFSKATLLQHPRFFSFVASGVSPYSVFGTILTDIYNMHGGGYALAQGACMIEEKIIRWMAGRAGFPQNTCGGLFVSGGSMANLSALTCARNDKLRDTEYPVGVAYVSDQSHSSIAKGLKIIGFRNDQIVKIPTDDEYKMKTDLLEERIKQDFASNRKPFVVIGSLGTTNTGSIDPLKEIARICKQYDLWFHIDGAFGGSILFSDIYRSYAAGAELADSLSWDLHKWALQVYGCSTFIVRDKKKLLNSFTEHPEYLEDIMTEENTDPWNMGIEMTRPHRSLRFWMTLQSMGTDLLADVIDYSFYNASVARKELLSLENWELTSPMMCATLTFRYAPPGMAKEEIDKLNLAISERIIQSGYAFIVTTKVKEKTVLRLCIINGNTTTEDVVDTIRKLDEIAKLVQKDIVGAVELS